MSKTFRITPLRGEYPFVNTDIRDGQRYLQLAGDNYSTKFHRHFTDAWMEWETNAELVFMKDLVTNAKKSD